MAKGDVAIAMGPIGMPFPDNWAELVKAQILEQMERNEEDNPDP